MEIFGFDPSDYIDEEVMIPWLVISGIAELLTVIMLKKWYEVAPFSVLVWIIALILVPAICYVITTKILLR